MARRGFRLLMEISTFVLGACLGVAGAQAQGTVPAKAAIAYVNGTTLTFASATGQVLKQIPLGRKIYDFDLSPNGKLMVAAAAETSYGGPLELFNLKTRKWTQLTHRQLYFHRLHKGAREVYADPDFSPDGRRIVFAIHVNSPGDGNDAVDASGPLAVMNLKTRKVRILEASTNLGGNGFCFANQPRWSPDGQEILFDCSDGAVVMDAAGQHARILPIGSFTDYAAGLGWLGNHCVLYLRAKNWGQYSSYEARFLNLKTGRSEDASQLLLGGSKTAQGLAEASPTADVQRMYFSPGPSPPVYLVSPQGKVALPEKAATELLDGWSQAALPGTCSLASASLR